jgi:hypothetical protein
MLPCPVLLSDPERWRRSTANVVFGLSFLRIISVGGSVLEGKHESRGGHSAARCNYGEREGGGHVTEVSILPSL